MSNARAIKYNFDNLPTKDLIDYLRSEIDSKHNNPTYSINTLVMKSMIDRLETLLNESSGSKYCVVKIENGTNIVYDVFGPYNSEEKAEAVANDLADEPQNLSYGDAHRLYRFNIEVMTK